MGTCIEAVATARRRSRLFGRGARHLSDDAARTCLTLGHHQAGELDMIVNVGLYKDHGLAEPALAALVQEDIGANPGSPPLGHHGTFSFDLADGGCGVLTAARLVTGFLESSAARLALVIAGDSDPSPATSRGFTFAPMGGALLLSHVEGDRGFRRFVARSFPSDAALFEARMRWDPDAGLIRRGRNVLEVIEAPQFAERCAEYGIDIARELLDAEGVSVADIDLLVASQYPRSFATRVGRALGVGDERIPIVDDVRGHAHTAGPLAALELATGSRSSRDGYTLFVTAGAGITVSAALYRSEVLPNKSPKKIMAGDRR